MQRLINIQRELKVPKNQRNNFGGYNYRSAEDILEALKPLLKAENVVLTLSDSLEHIGDRYYVKATATLYDNCKNIICSTQAFAREEENKKGSDGSQITGASSSYARKYALNGMFCIDDVKDSDATNTGEKPVDKKEVKEEETKCPICGESVSKGALSAWGMCSKCRAKKVKESKEKVETL